MAERFEWIPMSDGTRLACTLYLPDGDEPQPAIIEALPYRKDDITAYGTPEYRRLRDEGGYGVCRIDVRGTGSSEGIAVDEYPEQEQKDMCDAIAWLARRPWCTGKIGMYGTSYSGFNSIQVAMERPEELAAICTIFATDDRYTDDVHYGGGIRRALDAVDYPTYMVAMNALPPVPEIAGDTWRDMWRERIDKLEPWIVRWLGEQRDGPYWRHGSLRPDYDSIQCATMIVGGWADGYHNMTFRTFEALTCPKRLLIGPWAHASTETSKPGPRIDLVPEMIRWWDRWLRGRANGIDHEPPITVYVRRSTRPSGILEEVRGEFRFETQWPPERAREEVRTLGLATAVGRGREERDELEVRGDVGFTGYIWCAGVLPFGQPYDQRADEAFSLGYEWEPLAEELEILGYPRVELTVSSTAPVAFVSAKLCDVFPDGTSALVARTVFNLTHRDSHSDPEPLEPGRFYRVSIELDATSWVWEPGHRVRLDLAGADWPNVWPPPERSTLAIDRASSWLALPVVPADPSVSRSPELAPPRASAEQEGGSGDSKVTWREEHDVLEGDRRVVTGTDAGSELEVGGRLSEHYSGVTGVSTEDPGQAYARGRARFSCKWPQAAVYSESRMTLRSDKDAFHLQLDLEVGEDDGASWNRSWTRTYPRDLA